MTIERTSPGVRLESAVPGWMPMIDIEPVPASPSGASANPSTRPSDAAPSRQPTVRAEAPADEQLTAAPAGDAQQGDDAKPADRNAAKPDQAAKTDRKDARQKDAQQNGGGQAGAGQKQTRSDFEGRRSKNRMIGR